MTPTAPERLNEPPDVLLGRRTGVRRIAGWEVRSLRALWDGIGIAAPSEQCLMADLSLGPWRGHWIARQWGAQLGLPEPATVQPALQSPHAGIDAYADTVGTLIDNESEGDRNFIAAFNFATTLLRALRGTGITHLFVTAPLPGHAWGQENLQLLRLLADGAAAERLTLAILLKPGVVPPDAPGIEISPLIDAPPERGDAAPGGLTSWFVPGLIDPAVHVQPGLDTLLLRHGLYFVSPTCRQPFPASAPPMPGPLADPLRVPFELAAPTQDVDFLLAQADLRFSEGASELALHILDAIRTDRLSAWQSAQIDVQKQKIAIACLDFARAARGRLPEERLEPVVKASLYQSKAWGLVMSGHARDAEPWFALARQHLDPRKSQRLYLYLLNISALNRVRLDEVDQALRMEIEIERQLKALACPDWHLVYINCLNLARIYKRLRSFDEAQRYYDRAFYVNHQLRTESDLLYMNLCFAQLEALRGRPEQAALHWLRTCLHWLSNPMPEALAPRVAQAVLGRSLSCAEANVDALSDALARSLATALKAAGLDATPTPPDYRLVPFRRLRAGACVQHCHGQAGWSLFPLRSDAGSAGPIDSPAYAALNALVLGHVQRCLPELALKGVGGLLTDMQCGIDLPATPGEMAWSCMKAGVRRLSYQGRDYEIDPISPAILGQLRIVRSRAINVVETGVAPWRVHYKRYKAPLILDELQQRCLACLDEPRSVGELLRLADVDPARCVALLGPMTQASLVTIS